MQREENKLVRKALSRKQREAEKQTRAWETDHAAAYEAERGCFQPVSYTHLDVYKRQVQIRILRPAGTSCGFCP